MRNRRGRIPRWSGHCAKQTLADYGPTRVVILYTDGITDATGPAGNMLGEGGLLQIVRNLPVESPALMADGLLEAAQEFRGNALREDDQSFFILRQLEG
jgi:serine phosphatase RsbU (regulator of sigma subunit)